MFVNLSMWKHTLPSRSQVQVRMSRLPELHSKEDICQRPKTPPNLQPFWKRPLQASMPTPPSETRVGPCTCFAAAGSGGCALTPTSAYPLPEAMVRLSITAILAITFFANSTASRIQQGRKSNSLWALSGYTFISLMDPEGSSAAPFLHQEPEECYESV